MAEFLQIPLAVIAILQLSLVTWPWIVSEAGVDLVLIETSLLFTCKSCCSYFYQNNVNPSLAFNPSQDTKHTTDFYLA